MTFTRDLVLAIARRSEIDTAPNVAVLFNETDGAARAASLLKTIGRASRL